MTDAFLGGHGRPEVIGQMLRDHSQVLEKPSQNPAAKSDPPVPSTWEAVGPMVRAIKECGDDSDDRLSSFEC